MADLEQPSSVMDSSPVPTDTEATNTDTTNLEGLLAEQQAEPEEIEEELEGLKVRGKKDLVEEFKKGRMLHADYTRKTQAVAEEKRAFDSEKESFTRQRQMDAQLETEKFQVWNAHQRVQQLQQVNFAALRQANPEYADQLRDELAQLSAALPTMGNALSQKLQQRNLEAQQIDARRANDSEAVVMREVKDWGPEKLAKFVDAGQKAGLPPEGMRQLLIHFPQAARFLNESLMYRQLLAARMQKPAAEPQKPVTRVGGGSASNTRPLSEVTDPREWAARRNERKGRNTAKA